MRMLYRSFLIQFICGILLIGGISARNAHAQINKLGADATRIQQNSTSNGLGNGSDLAGVETSAVDTSPEGTAAAMQGNNPASIVRSQEMITSGKIFNGFAGSGYWTNQYVASVATKAGMGRASLRLIDPSLADTADGLMRDGFLLTGNRMQEEQQGDELAKRDFRACVDALMEKSGASIEDARRKCSLEAPVATGEGQDTPATPADPQLRSFKSDPAHPNYGKAANDPIKDNQILLTDFIFGEQIRVLRKASSETIFNDGTPESQESAIAGLLQKVQLQSIEQMQDDFRKSLGDVQFLKQYDSPGIVRTPKLVVKQIPAREPFGPTRAARISERWDVLHKLLKSMCEFENSDKRQTGSERLNWLPKRDLTGKLLPATNTNNFWAKDESQQLRVSLSQPYVTFTPEVAKGIYELWKQESVPDDSGKLACEELAPGSTSLAALTRDISNVNSSARRAVVTGERIRAAYAVAEQGVDGEWLYSLATAEAVIANVVQDEEVRSQALKLLLKSAGQLAPAGTVSLQQLWLAHIERVRSVQQAIVGGWKAKISSAGANIQLLFSGSSGAGNQGDASTN